MATRPFEAAPAPREGGGYHLREFLAAMVPFEDMVRGLSENPSEEELDKCAVIFLRDYKKYFKFISTKDQLLGYLEEAQRAEDENNRTQMPGTSKMSRFYAKVILRMESAESAS